MRPPEATTPTPTPLPPVVAVGAGKGGVGTSTVAALLACTAAADGIRVLLIDAAQHFGGLGTLLGVEAPLTLADLKGGAHHVQELVVPVAANLSLIQAGHQGPGLTATEHQLLLRRLQDLFRHYQLVIIDAGASAASLRSAIRCGASRVLTITVHDRISLTATYAVIKLLHQETPAVRVDVVANRVDAEAAGRLHEYLHAASVRFLSRTVPFAGTVPDDPAFARVVAAGLGTDEAALGSPAAQAVRAIGAQLLADTVSPPFLRLLRKG